MQQGLGDTVEKITKVTGIAKVVKSITAAVGIEDCGCEKRKEALNKLFPYTNKDNGISEVTTIESSGSHQE